MTVNRAFSVGILIFATHAVPARAPEGKTPEMEQYSAISFFFAADGSVGAGRVSDVSATLARAF